MDIIVPGGERRTFGGLLLGADHLLPLPASFIFVLLHLGDHGV
jgi:hypothetical protein